MCTAWVSRGRVAAAVLVVGALGALPCRADPVDLGQAAGFGVLGLDNTAITISGPSGVDGNLGVGPHGSATLSGSAFVTGFTFANPSATLSASGTSSFGTVVTQDLSQAGLDARSASAVASALTPTQSLGDVSITSPGQDVTVNGSAGLNVISIGNFNDSNGTFTVHGAPGSTFVFNVSGDFNVSGGSSIVLSGGINPRDVLFNFPTAGSTVAFTGGSTMNGIFLSPDRGFSLSGGTLNGEVISGASSISITSGGQVDMSVVPEPTSLASLGIGGLLVAGLNLRRRRRRTV